MKRNAPTSSTTVLIALVAIVLIVAAAAMFATGDNALERLAVLAGIIGLILPTVLALLKSDQAASASHEAAASSHQAAEQTNGSLDQRIALAVAAALQARRSGDSVQVVHTERRTSAGPSPASADPLTADPDVVSR